MASPLGDRLRLSDPEIATLAEHFTNSAYADDTYAGWPLDRRLEGFLRHLDLSSIAEDGDTFGILLDRVMACISALSRPGAGASESADGKADERPPTRGLRSLSALPADWCDG